MKKTQISIQAGKFKAKCLQLLDEVRDKQIKIIITKRGVPFATLIPMEDKPKTYFGCMKNTISTVGDIISPIDVKWNAEE